MYDRKSSEPGESWAHLQCQHDNAHTHTNTCREILPHVAGNVLARLNGSIVLISLSCRFVCPSPRRARVVMLPACCSSCSCPCGYRWLAVTHLFPDTLSPYSNVCRTFSASDNVVPILTHSSGDAETSVVLRHYDSFLPACRLVIILPSSRWFLLHTVPSPSSSVRHRQRLGANALWFFPSALAHSLFVNVRVGVSPSALPSTTTCCCCVFVSVCVLSKWK